MSEDAAIGASDIQKGDWVDRFAPPRTRPFLRLARVDRPIGIWLLMLPCWWSIALASTDWPDLRLLGLFALGATLMRAAGCTYNDLADREVDAKVARTATRPLPSGAVTPRQAAVFTIALCVAALLVLLQFNWFAVGVGTASLLVVAIYPFAKRFTDWPQAVLGLAFNWGALLGWAAVRGDLPLPAILLYLGGVFWTLGYDTIYAHQDKDDDILIGVKSTALRLGAASRRCVFGFYAAAWMLTAAAGLTAGLTWVLLVLLLPALGHLAWQAITVDFDDAHDCRAKFKSNRMTGFCVFVAIVVARVSS